jgi:dTDP-4-amino-4,6-dideoxygalactose transaminase
MKIPFFKTTITGEELKYIEEVFNADDSFAGKNIVAKCEKWFREEHDCKNFFLTKSCTSSLELAALMLDIKKGDEVILPSYAFVSCGSAFALRGVTCVFVDIRPDTMNIDETQIEGAITARTKAIVALNYAGVACDYETIDRIAKKHGLYVVEDNAHGILAEDNGKYLGTFGDISTFSFDHLKNVSCGQGGGIAINNETLLEKFFIHYEFGTNRRSFFLGNANRYEWKGLGSNYPLSELNAAMLFAQLENGEIINSSFVKLWSRYFNQLSDLEKAGKIDLPHIPANAKHNAHCFYIKTENAEVRTSLIKFLHTKEINAQFHYTPLHSSEFGKAAGRFEGEDIFTSKESNRLLRLPLFFSMTEAEVDEVSSAIHEFYK